MSHYGGSNAWQNPKNSATSQQQQQSNQQQQQSTSTSSSLYSNPANLLAQFAATANLNSQLNSLAANLPAVLISAQQSAAAAAAGYQWHSQNKLVMGNNSAATTNNNNKTPAPNNNSQGGYGNKQTSGYANNNNNNNHHHNITPKSLMDLDVNKTRNNNGSGGHINSQQQQQQRYNDNKHNNMNNQGVNRVGAGQAAVSTTPTSSAVLTQSLLNQIALTNQLAAAQTLGRIHTHQTSNLVDLNRNNNNNNKPNKMDDSRSHSQRRSRSRSPSRANSVQNNNHQKYRHPTAISNNNRNDSVSNNKSGRAHSKSRSPRRQQSGAANTKKPTQSSSSSGKHSIKLPRDSFDVTTQNVAGIKSAYSSLYVPSDFSNTKYGWVNSLPVSRPLKFTSRCSFHIMSKDAQPLTKNTAVLEPSDLDYRWNAKVMLLAMPSINDLYKRSCAFADEIPSSSSATSVGTSSVINRHDHPSKVIQFLVGNKGKHELMALGGPWSPSLDGPNPALNTQTLINCAIRNVKALTGIDLNPCTQWFRFIDIQYNRSEGYRYVKRASTTTSSSDGDQQDLKDALLFAGIDPDSKIQLCDEELEVNEDADVENTVIFLPNVWSLMPDSDEYQRIAEAYKNYVDNPPATSPADDEDNEKKNSEATATTTPAATAAAAAGDTTLDESKSGDQQQAEQKNETTSPSKNGGGGAAASSLTSESNTSMQMNESGGGIEDAVANNEDEQQHADAVPTHHSKLDLKKMRVDELRMELAARKLDTTGLKAHLLTRLKAVIEAEKEKEESEPKVESGDEDQMQIDTSMVVGESNEQPPETTTATENQEDNQPVGEDVVNTVKSENDQQQVGKEAGNTATATTPVADKITRADRERIYKLPNNPHIIIHSSKAYKGGKFDCQLVSLSHLLDYRKDDNKECSFEVFLFAECFNNMLMRDHAFHIYKHLLSLNEEAAAAASNKRKAATTTTEENGESSKKQRVDEASSSSSPATTESADPSSTRDNDKSVVTTTTPAKPLKPRTVHPQLLLAFTYFDSHRSGQLYERDLEDLFFLIGLNLTRSKVKSLLKKVTTATRDGLVNYRQLTDFFPNSTTSSLAMAVHYRLPEDEEFVNNLVSFEAYMRRLNSGTSTLFKSSADIESSGGVKQESLIVEINGRAIDILNTVKKLEDCELTLLKYETRCRESLEEIDRLKVVNRSGERAKQRLSDELDECKKKMREQQRSSKELDDKYARAKDSLYKTKSYLNRALDEVNDCLKRGQPKVAAKTASETTTTTASSGASNSTPAATTTATTTIGSKSEGVDVDENSKQNDESSTNTKQEADVFDETSNNNIKNNDNDNDDFTSDNFANGNFEDNSNNAVA